MKLRFENNSVRIRIRKSELLHLKENNSITEEISFPGTYFTYGLRIADVADIMPEWSDKKLEIHLPVVKAGAWINSDEVGLYHLINIDNDEALEIIIEKDFPCKDRTGEDKADTFSELAAKKSNDERC